jgi:hypothetical protein
MLKFFYRHIFFSLLMFFLALPLFVRADNAVLGGLSQATAGVFNPIDSETSTDLGSIIGLVVKISLGMLGVIFIVLIIYSGFTWMMAAGEEAKVTKAKDTIRRAIIGLIIIVSSFSFWLFIQNVLFS